MICSECNTKNAKGANFCSKCGKKLGDEVVNNNVNFSDIIKNLLDNIKGVFVTPIDTAKKFIKEENYMTGLLYLCLNIVVMALFVLAVVNSLANLVTNTLGYGYNMYDYFYNTSEIPYLRLFLVSIMTGVIVYALFAGVAYLISRCVFKSNTSFQKMTTWLGINSVFNTATLVVVAICLLISVKLGLIVYLVSAILYTYNLCKSLEFATDTNENKLGYVLMPTIVITLLVELLVLPKIFF